MKDQFGIETKLFDNNIFWEKSLSDAESIVLNEIQYKCRLSKGACTESNKTIGLRIRKSPDTVSDIISRLVAKGWINYEQDTSERSQRRITLTRKSIALITNEFADWYLIKVGKFADPNRPENDKTLLTQEELRAIIGDKKLKRIPPHYLDTSTKK